MPVSFEICFVAILTMHLLSAERDLAQLEFHKQVVQAMRNSGTWVTRFALAVGAGVENQRIGELDEMIAHMQHPETVPQTQFPMSPELKELHDDVDQVRGDILRFLQTGRALLGNSPTAPGASGIFNGFMRHNKPTLLQLLMEIDPVNARLAEFESHVRAQEPKQLEELRSYLTWSLTLGILLSISISVGLVMLFSRALREGLERVADNARRIAGREQLLAVIDGDNEIAGLDRVLHEANDTLAYSRQKELAVLDNAAGIICALDEHLKFVRVNLAAVALWKVDPTELIGHPLSSLLKPERSREIEDQFRDIAVGTGYGELETQIVCSDGSLVDSLWTVNWSKEDCRYYCVVLDVTEKRKLERFKRKVVSIVSHDMRAPLMALSINLNLAAQGRRGVLSESVSREVNELEVKLGQLMRQMNDFLELEKIGMGKAIVEHDCLSATGVCAEAKAQLEDVLTMAKVTVSGPVGDAALSGDERRLVQMMSRLLANAVSRSPAGAAVNISLSSENHLVTIKVTDNGAMVPIEQQSLLFEMLHQSSHGQSSTLGLPLVRAIALAHGGTSGIESNSASTTFFATIPEFVDPEEDDN